MTTFPAWNEAFNRWTKEDNSEALRLFYKAIELDPDFSSAFGMASFCYVLRKVNGWRADPVQETAEGSRLAQRAADLGKDDAVALGTAGQTFRLFGSRPRLCGRPHRSRSHA